MSLFILLNLVILFTSALEWFQSNSPLAIVAAILASVSLLVSLLDQFESILLKTRKLYLYLVRRKIPDLIKSALEDGKLTRQELYDIIRAVVSGEEEKKTDNE